MQNPIPKMHEVYSKCNICQQTKCTTKKYGHLPPKEAKASPWEVLCVDLIGPYTIKNLVLWCVTMINQATGWFKMQEIPNKEAFTIANFVKQTWLTRYPWPNQIIFNQGKEFMGEFAHMVKKDCGMKGKPKLQEILKSIV
jgi:hypothetical protein